MKTLLGVLPVPLNRKGFHSSVCVPWDSDEGFDNELGSLLWSCELSVTS